MKSRSFVLSAIILTLGGFFAKAIGALYKIPLTNILGSSGMGLYYLIFPIYSLIITFCSSGINIALATEVAKCRKIRHRYNEQKLLRIALLISFVLSFVCTILILLISRPIAEIQGNINARLGYIAIAPAIIISSIIATLRGYFQGVENMVPTTVSMIIEQIVKLSLGLVLAYKLCNFGVQYAVLGAIIGVTLSEVVALIIISINFLSFKGQLYYNYKNKFFKKKKNLLGSFIKNKSKLYKKYTDKIKCKNYVCNSKNIRYSNKVAFKKLFKIFFSTTLSSLILPIATMLDSFLIINLLMKSGYSSLISTSLYGIYGGIVQSLISLPIIVISGISTSIIPSLSGLVAGRDVGNVNRRVSFFIKLSFVLSLFMFAVIFVFAKDILYFLYGDGLNTDVIDELYYATKMLRIASISIVYYAFLQTFTSVLQSIGKSHLPFWFMLIGLIARILLTITLVRNPSINIFGAEIASIVFLVIVNILLAIFIKKNIDLEFKLFKHLIMPLIIILAILSFMQLSRLGFSLMFNYFISMVISIVLGLIIFCIWIYWSGVFTVREKKDFFLRKRKSFKTKQSQMK